MIKIIDLKKNKKKEYRPPTTHEDLPQLHFTMCVVGPRNRGKSLLIRNLLLRKDLMRDTFADPHYMIFVSPNIDVNGDYDEVKGFHVYRYDFYNPSLIEFLIETQKNIITTHGKKKCPEILLVLDDVLDSGALDYHSQIEKVFSRGRHVNMNCILVSQHLNRISRTMRLNNDYFVMFMPNNETELDNFLEQYVSKPDRNRMREYLKNMWNESIYNFILVDYKTDDPSRKYRKGFSEPIILDRDI